MATPSTFVYEAQTPQGQTLSGTLDADSIEQASAQLQALQLRIIRIEPAQRAPASKAFASEDFLAFNQQLAHLTAAGIPMERGLRLIASDLGSRRRAAAVNRIAAELEKGVSVEAAFSAQQQNFPPLYGKLLGAGVRAGNLPGMLLSVSRHVELIGRLRAAVWKAASYPLMVLIALLLVMGFIWGWVIPHFGDLRNIDPSLGYVTHWPPTASPASVVDPTLVVVAAWLSYVLMALIALFLISVLALCLVARTRSGSRWVERVVLQLPLIGPVLHWNLLARWCDALQLGIAAGLDLPASLEMAGDVVDSAKVRADTRQMVENLRGGKSIDEISGLRFLPAIVPASLQLGSTQNNLPATVATLAKMYQEQAEVRLNVLPAALSPVLLLMITMSVGLAVGCALMPMVQLIRSFMR